MHPRFALFFARGLRPSLKVVNVFFINKNRSTRETAGNQVSFNRRLEPRWHAATDDAEVGIVDFLYSALSRLLFVKVTIPNVGHESNHAFVQVLSADEGIEFVSKGCCLVIDIIFAAH